MNPVESETPAAQEPAITPELLRDHGITPEEYQRILKSLGRTPTLTELGIFSVMWSEHCSYKSSRVHLKRLPTRSRRVVQGPGENAGIIDIGDGWACAFKIESHNHPSFIEPFQGATTGVGGILRDIFTMGARPVAIMDSLRFGPITPQPRLDQATLHKNHSVMEGVVSGVASYGNCFGVPNVGGEVKFESCYNGNPLVNAFALGLVRRDQIFYAKASGAGNPVIYVGSKTGRDGIHGATMASEEFREDSEAKRPNVQVGDPFLEKLLLEACLEAMQTGAIIGIQDMGAAGLTCSTCEMGGRGGVGLEIELDLVPQRDTGMTPYEIMLSESQERMLLVAEKGREQEVFRVFEKWGLDAVAIGSVIPESTMRVLEHGKVVAEIPNQALTDEAPLYNRPMERWEPPVAREMPENVAVGRKTDLTGDLKQLLATPNICSKRWVFEQYDSMVQTNTVEGPGRRGRSHSDQGYAPRPGDGARRQWTLVLSRPQAGCDACGGRVGAQCGLLRRDADRGHQLPELRQSREAAHHVAVCPDRSMASPRPARNWRRRSLAATSASTTKRWVRAFIRHRLSGSSASWRMFTKRLARTSNRLGRLWFWCAAPSRVMRRTWKRNSAHRSMPRKFWGRFGDSRRPWNSKKKRRCRKRSCR